MDVEKILDFSVEAVEEEKAVQEVNTVQLGCWGAGSDDDNYC